MVRDGAKWLARWRDDALLWWVGLTLFWLALHGVLALGSPNVWLDWFHYDDAFYYFKVAQNIVAGLGPTFDGTGPTNGFHPLWMLLLLPVYALSGGDGLLALRGVLMLVGGLLVLSAGVYFWAARRAFGPAAAWAGVGVWLFLPPLYLRLSAGGMESAVSVAALLLFWALQAEGQRRERMADPRWVLAVGVAAALVMLARLDNAIVVAVVGLLWLWRWWRAKVGRRRLVALALAYGLPGLVGVGGFLLWSRMVVGTWLPVSSQVKMWWGSLVDTPYGRAMRYRILRTLARLARPRAWPQVDWSALGLMAIVAVAGMALLIALPAAARQWPRAVAWLRRRALVGMTSGAVVHYVYLQVGSGLSPLRSWYWTAEWVTALLWLSALLVWALWGRPADPHWVRTIMVLAGVGFALWMWGTYLPHRETLHPYLHQARWVKAHTEPGAVIGAAGSGALGYFVQDRRVLNLDGLIAPVAYLRALQQGQGVAYLQRQGLRYVVGAFWLTKLAPYRMIFANRLEPVAEYRYRDVKATLYLFLP